MNKNVKKIVVDFGFFYHNLYTKQFQDFSVGIKDNNDITSNKPPNPPKYQFIYIYSLINGDYYTEYISLYSKVF